MPYLNSVIEAAASKAGVRYVDVSRALNGHAICSEDPHAHGLTFGDDKYLVLNASSFHPSDKGQADMFNTLFKAVPNIGKQQFTNPAPDPTVTAPHVPSNAGTGVAASVFDLGLGAAGAINPISTFLRIANDGVVSVTGHDFAPDSIVKGALYSTVVNLGTQRADANGEVTFAVKIPSDLEPGLHHVELSGTDADGDPRLGVATLFVEASPADADGDAVTDGSDNCEYLANTDQADEDEDALGNACDPDFQLVVTNQPPVFLPEQPPVRAEQGKEYTHTFRASGASTYSIATGSLPPGLSLTATGELRGVPTQPGTFRFSVNGTGDYGTTTAGPFTIEVMVKAGPTATPSPQVPTPVASDDPMDTGPGTSPSTPQNPTVHVTRMALKPVKKASRLRITVGPAKTVNVVIQKRAGKKKWKQLRKRWTVNTSTTIDLPRGVYRAVIDQTATGGKKLISKAVRLKR
jgi:hypothetical protein